MCTTHLHHHRPCSHITPCLSANVVSHCPLVQARLSQYHDQPNQLPLQYPLEMPVACSPSPNSIFSQQRPTLPQLEMAGSADESSHGNTESGGNVCVWPVPWGCGREDNVLCRVGWGKSTCPWVSGMVGSGGGGGRGDAGGAADSVDSAERKSNLEQAPKPTQTQMPTASTRNQINGVKQTPNSTKTKVATTTDPMPRKANAEEGQRKRKMNEKAGAAEFEQKMNEEKEKEYCGYIFMGEIQLQSLTASTRNQVDGLKQNSNSAKTKAATTLEPNLLKANAEEGERMRTRKMNLKAEMKELERKMKVKEKEKEYCGYIFMGEIQLVRA